MKAYLTNRWPYTLSGSKINFKKFKYILLWNTVLNTKIALCNTLSMCDLKTKCTGKEMPECSLCANVDQTASVAIRRDAPNSIYTKMKSWVLGDGLCDVRQRTLSTNWGQSVWEIRLKTECTYQQQKTPAECLYLDKYYSIKIKSTGLAT